MVAKVEGGGDNCTHAPVGGHVDVSQVRLDRLQSGKPRLPAIPAPPPRPINGSDGGAGAGRVKETLRPACGRGDGRAGRTPACAAAAAPALPRCLGRRGHWRRSAVIGLGGRARGRQGGGHVDVPQVRLDRLQSGKPRLPAIPAPPPRPINGSDGGAGAGRVKETLRPACGRGDGRAGRTPACAAAAAPALPRCLGRRGHWRRSAVIGLGGRIGGGAGRGAPRYAPRVARRT